MDRRTANSAEQYYFREKYNQHYTTKLVVLLDPKSRSTTNLKIKQLTLWRQISIKQHIPTWRMIHLITKRQSPTQWSDAEVITFMSQRSYIYVIKVYISCPEEVEDKAK